MFKGFVWTLEVILYGNTYQHLKTLIVWYYIHFRQHSVTLFATMEWQIKHVTLILLFLLLQCCPTDGSLMYVLFYEDDVYIDRSDHKCRLLLHVYPIAKTVCTHHKWSMVFFRFHVHFNFYKNHVLSKDFNRWNTKVVYVFIKWKCVICICQNPSDIIKTTWVKCLLFIVVVMYENFKIVFQIDSYRSAKDH